jgi:2-methylcitrate dehydratase PrpD
MINEMLRTDGTAPVAPGAIETAVVDFIAGFRLQDVTEAHIRGVRQLVLDQMANQIACSQLPWCRNTLAFAQALALPGTARVVCSDLRLSSHDAAFVNATFGHSFEYDDAHRESASHPGSCVVAATFALAEEVGAPMDEALAALIVGYEVYTRIGSIAAPDLLVSGFHPHSVLATFGAAAIAARLHGLTREETWNALSMALSHASGTTEYSSSGGSIKRVHSGIGTLGGLRAAQMARHGVTGPRTFLSGNKGFYRTFVNRALTAADVARFAPDAPFEIEKVWIKPYLCCGCIHAYIDAVSPFAGQLDTIAAIDVRIQRSANVPVGTKNANAYAPRTIEHVQYSLPVQLAFTLLGMGNGYKVHLAALHEELDLSDGGAILTAARLVQIVEDPDLDDRYPGKFVADVAITFKDGTVHRAFVEDSSGTVENPMNTDQLEAKFHELVDTVIGRDRADRLVAAIRELGGKGAVSDFTALASA